VWIAVSSIGPSEEIKSLFSSTQIKWLISSTHSRPWRRHADWPPPHLPAPQTGRMKIPQREKRLWPSLASQFFTSKENRKLEGPIYRQLPIGPVCRYVVALTASCRSQYRGFALIIKTEPKHRRVQVWVRSVCIWSSWRIYEGVDAGVDELRLPLATVICYVPPRLHWAIQNWFENPYNI